MLATEQHQPTSIMIAPMTTADAVCHAAHARSVARAKSEFRRAMGQLVRLRAGTLSQGDLNDLHGRALRTWPNLQLNETAKYQELLLRDLTGAYEALLREEEA